MKSGRFVIQKHTVADGGFHWDLMLEDGDLLQTWRLEMPPEKINYEPAPAEKIFAHPLKFLTYEGLVQNGKGTVEIADTGDYKTLLRNENNLLLELKGRVLRGLFEFSKNKNTEWVFNRYAT